MCRSRRELSNAYFVANFGFDTAVHEPCKVCPLSAYRFFFFFFFFFLLLLLQIPQVVAVRLMLHWLRYRFFVGALHIAVQLRSNACDKTREVWTCTNGELTILHAAAYDICDECFRAEVLFSRGADRSKHGISSMLVFNFGLSFGYCLIIHKRLQLSC